MAYRQTRTKIQFLFEIIRLYVVFFIPNASFFIQLNCYLSFLKEFLSSTYNFIFPLFYIVICDYFVT